MARKVIAGQDVFDAQRSRKIALLGDLAIYESEALCRWQQAESGRGIIPAEIVESNYGFSVRYASGLQNFGLLASSRRGDVDGTLEAAIAFAEKWQAEDKDRRFVLMSVQPEPADELPESPSPRA